MRASLDPWVAAGVLDPTDLHVATTVAELWRATSPSVALALALAVRAPRFGHLAVDLSDPMGLATDIGEAWPVDAVSLEGEPWIAEVAGCDAVAVALADDEVATLPFVLHGSWLYTARYWNYQVRAARRIRRWVHEAPTLGGDRARLGRGLDVLFRPPGADLGAPARSDEPLNRQRLGAAMACTRPFCVITGGPGMGKTWTIRNVLALWFVEQALGGSAEVGLRVALAAPTGKAAARMRASIRERLDEVLRPAVRAWLADEPERERIEAELTAWLTDLPAFTLHRLLGYRRDRPSRFRHHRDAPLPYDAVIVDETSMVDFALMAKLLDAIGPGTRLVLLGDRHQLASVEAGTVLSDICGPVRAREVRLTERGRQSLAIGPSLALQASDPALEIVSDDRVMHDVVVQFDRTYRFAPDSGIGRFAAACLRQPFDADAAMSALTNPDAADVTQLAPGDDGTLPARARAGVVDGYAAYLDALRSADPADEAEERRLHRTVLERFERFRLLCAHRRGRLGVSGINEQVELWLRRAGYLTDTGRFYEGRPVLVQQNDYAVRRFNGDIGLVVRPRFGAHRDRRVVVFPGEAGPDDVDYLAPSRLPVHDTVFAMTIHKSQGSEYEHAMIVLPREPSAVCTRELVYTGVTRARLRMTMVARTEVLEAALARQVRRASGLEAALWGER